MLKVVKVKGCKRCGGDLFLERDSDGVYVTCLQCGAVYAGRSKGESRQGMAEIPAPAKASGTRLLTGRD
jgi:ribosomal protein L37AE/L43A